MTSQISELIQPSHGYAHISNSGTGSLSYSSNQSSDRISEKVIIVKYEPVIRSSVSTYVANFTFIQRLLTNASSGQFNSEAELFRDSSRRFVI